MMTETYRNIYVTINMHDENFIISIQICKKIYIQYKKTLAYNISGHEQQGDRRKDTVEVTDIPVQVDETCGISLDNPSWHVDVDNHNTTSTACKIYQTQYPCQSIHLQHINIYE